MDTRQYHKWHTVFLDGSTHTYTDAMIYTQKFFLPSAKIEEAKQAMGGKIAISITYLGYGPKE